MAGLNLASVPQSNSEKFFPEFTRPITRDELIADLVDLQLRYRAIPEDEPEEHDDTEWQDFLGYHSEVLR